MYKPRSIQSSLSFSDKILSLDYILIFSILILGVISMFAMYSTDGGEFKYHTNSHILRFFVFFGMFFFVSFIQTRFWHSQSYLIYIVIFLLLIGVKYFGLTSSGSKRWLDLYFMNLQPSELMKVSLILFLAKYYHRTSIDNINSIRYLFLSCRIRSFFSRSRPGERYGQTLDITMKRNPGLFCYWVMTPGGPTLGRLKARDKPGFSYSGKKRKKNTTRGH